MKSPLIIGVMSGTSLDGLDIAACKFWNEKEQWKFEIVKAETCMYSANEKEQLKGAFKASGMELIALHHQYGNKIGERVKQFCESNNINPDYIASHGHTIFHQPQNGFTFQLGHGANIAAQSGIKTICDFRTTDVAFGGQGAPLVPIGDELLFAEYDYCLNLGGISNISFTQNGKRKAFDIGICNMALNHLVEELNINFDKDGLIAATGNINQTLLQQLVDTAKVNHNNQQSLGYEWYFKFIQPLLNLSQLAVADKLRTFCAFIATQIAAITSNQAKVLVTGGGAKNKFLMQCIQEKSTAKLELPQHQLIDFKEALIFAFLGLLRVNEQPNCLMDVTGAAKNAIGGSIYLP